MKKEYALFNLREANEHLDEIITKIENSHHLEPLMNGELKAYFQELYWHINKVWNGRNMAQDKIYQAQDKEFDELCDFPKDIEV